MAGNVNPVKVGIIGCGSIGNTHAENYLQAPSADLVAVCDIIEDKAKALADKSGVHAVFTDYHKLLADPAVEAVSVCLPNDLHHPVTLDALKAGKHVLCEKPIALNMAQALAMRDAARAAKKILSIGVVNRYNTFVNLLKDTIARGDLGDVYHVMIMFKSYRSIPGLGGWFTTKARAGGGVMIDWGVHFVDLVLYCLGFPKLKTLSGVAHGKLAANPRDYAYTNMWAAAAADFDGVCDIEEYAAGLIRAEGGLALTFEGAWAQNVGEGQMYIEFLGTKGGARLAYGGPYTLWHNQDGILYKTETDTLVKPMFVEEVEDFCLAVRSGKPTRSDIETVLDTQAVLDALYRSAKEGREVPVGE